MSSSLTKTQFSYAVIHRAWISLLIPLAASEREGGNVTYVAMQLAYYMWLSKAILIGVDHNFATQGQPHKVVVSQGDDPNHFSRRYFGRDFRWKLPDLEMSEIAYRLAGEGYVGAGREILDATVGGKLENKEILQYLHQRWNR